jgi:hypothetical protein
MRKFYLLVASVVMAGCSDTTGSGEYDTRDHAKVRVVNAYREDQAAIVQVFREDGIEVGTGKAFGEAQPCTQAAGSPASTVPQGEHRLDFKRAGEDEVMASITHTYDPSKEYLIVLMPDLTADPRAPKAVVFEEDFSGVGTVHADSFALRVINAGSTAGNVYLSIVGPTSGGFAAGPALTTGSDPAVPKPEPLHADTVTAKFTLDAGASTTPLFTTYRSATIPAGGGNPAKPGFLRLRLFSDGLLTRLDNTTGDIVAVDARSNFVIATSAFTVANNRMATVILTDRPNSGPVTGVIAPRCAKIA